MLTSPRLWAQSAQEETKNQHMTPPTAEQRLALHSSLSVFAFVFSHIGMETNMASCARNSCARRAAVTPAKRTLPEQWRAEQTQRGRRGRSVSHLTARSSRHRIASHRALLLRGRPFPQTPVQCVGCACVTRCGARTDCGRDSGERQSGGGDQLPLRRKLTARALLGVAGGWNEQQGTHTCIGQ